MQRTYKIDDSIQYLPGVGPKKKNILEKVNIHTIRDLLFYYPRAYEKRGNIRSLLEGTDGEKSAFLLTIETTPKLVRLKNNMSILKFKACDQSGSITINFFNQEFLLKTFHPGLAFRFYGKLTYKSTWELNSPEYELYTINPPLKDFYPIYSLCNGLSQKWILSCINTALKIPIEDYLPENIRLDNQLCTKKYALEQIHNPESEDALSKSIKRLVFDEFFITGIGMHLSRSKKQIKQVPRLNTISWEPFLERVPFKLTKSQLSFLKDIENDFSLSDNNLVSQMHRILIGDVGSGKTICAMAALFYVVQNGYQGAIMAPTEILATQHYIEMKEFFSFFGINVVLLTSATKKKEKEIILQELAKEHSSIHIVVGTHAIIQEQVVFNRLLLTIIDEQHRFGIVQRTALEEKSQNGHILVMSATPIPRSLALTLYGDLSLSTLDELPSGRKKIETYQIDESYRNRINAFISKQVELGGQVYVICPLIEQNEEDTNIYGLSTINQSPILLSTKIDVKTKAQELQNLFPQYNIGLLHGKLKQKEKDQVMQDFKDHKTQILVCTTVVEVGVNVPNANVMIIENADCFGLAQLHQLRGRVGRGTRQSYCILFSNTTNEQTKKRMEIICSTTNGFEIAEKDLQLRGPGDFFTGATNSEYRQSGSIQYRLAKYCDDIQLLKKAYDSAKTLINNNPALMGDECKMLKNELIYYYDKFQNDIS